jgi:stage V sporulation protein D (sporulation-specific penicillin-binding protein)
MTWRYRFVLLLFTLFFCAIIGRLFYWQVVRAQELSDLGRKQYGKEVTVQPTRGEIFTSDGFAIVANKLSYLIYANPKAIKDKQQDSEILAPLLSVETASISARLETKDVYWVSLQSQVEKEVKDRIESLKLPGIGFEEQSQRFYPEASVGAKILGFVGKDGNGGDKGYFGLEGYYDRQLRGKEGMAIQIHDAFGNPILAKMNDTVGVVDGRDLLLHIDRTIQFLLDRELQAGVLEYGASGGTAIVMDPKTGGILALSSFPTYDPREYAKYTDDLYRNPVITDAYEPGSTFKPLIMASAIDAGLVTPDTICTICSGPVQIGEYQIKTWNNEYTANTTMTEVIQHSDNTGMVFVGRLLGLDRLLSYLDQFGIGQMTGIDLQGEMSPDLRPRNSWYPIDLATATFGQGITITPIELLTAFSAIANGGKRMEPHIVAAIQTPTGEKINLPPKVLSKPISEKAAKIMTEMMVNAVDNGEAKWAKPKGYRIAGKTGTAQIPVAGHYDANKTIASFIGFAPADDPKFLMLVVIDRPTTSIYGAETAAPVFFRVAKNILLYYGIPPSE